MAGEPRPRYERGSRRHIAEGARREHQYPYVRWRESARAPRQPGP